MKNKLIITLAIALTISAFSVGCSSTKDKPEVEEQVSSKEESEPIDITISASGDVTLGNYKGASYAGTFDNEFDNQGKDHGHFFENVKEIFENDDLTLVNFEGTLTESNDANIKKFAFKGDPSYVNILKEGNVEAVNIANNHSEDYKEKGLEDTKKILKDNGIEYFGMGEKSIIEVKGVKVGLLGYLGWDELYNEKTLNSMKKDLEQMEKDADMTVVYFHWGSEGAYEPNKYQKDFAYHAIDNGGDVVLGGHPHVLQGVEIYKEKYIAYSLGNFAFGGNKNPRDKDTMIYQQTFTIKDGELVSISKPNLIPCSISSSKGRNDYKPMPLSGGEGERVLDKIEGISQSIQK